MIASPNTRSRTMQTRRKSTNNSISSNQETEEINSGEEEKRSAGTWATTRSSMRDPRITTNKYKMQFQHHKRKYSTFLNIRLKVEASRKILT